MSDASLIVPIILSGGSGTRLWPLSRESTPKQLLRLVTGQTLLQDTARRVVGLAGNVAPPVVVCSERHAELVSAQLRAVDVAPAAILLEPAGRNSAPAIAAAALHSLRTIAPTGVEPLLLVLPSDHVLLDVASFASALEAALEPAKEGRLVTFGVVPDRPETGYGYLRRGAERGAWAELDGFVEKPDRATAQAYVASGRYLWNSGMFLFPARVLLRELAEHAGALLAAADRALEQAEVEGGLVRLGPAFLDSPSISIDYAVMEKTRRAAVVPLAAGWSDVGSWAALHDVLPKDRDGNVAAGDVMIESCTNAYVAAHSRLVVAIGLNDVVIVETDDAVLVVAREHAESVKQVVAALRSRGPGGGKV